MPVGPISCLTNGSGLCKQLLRDRLGRAAALIKAGDQRMDCMTYDLRAVVLIGGLSYNYYYDGRNHRTLRERYTDQLVQQVAKELGITYGPSGIHSP